MVPRRRPPTSNLVLEHESLFLLSPQRKHTPYGLIQFLGSPITVPFALFGGLVCLIAATVFTAWLSQQNFQCPSWAMQCTVDPNVAWIRARLGTVQGIITVVFMAGLAAIAFVAHVFAETMVWPLLRKQTYTLKQLDTYLSASRGSIVSVLFAFGAARDLETVLIILCLSVLALVPFSAAPLVGYIYEPHNITMSFKASYLPAGGMGPNFTQQGIPPIMPSSVSQAVGKYIAWSNDLSSEPLPEYRDWYVNRDYLSELGNFTVNAVRLEKSINCTGHHLELKHTPGDNFLTVATPLSQNHPGRNRSDERVKIRNQPRLTVWVHDFDFISPHRTRSTLIFAALNGTIQGGTVAYAPTTWDKNWSRGISAVSCTADVELVDDTLIVGSGYIKPAEPITSVDIVGTGRGGHINEIALWFGVAPTVVGVNVEGCQPLFQPGAQPGAHKLPISFTSTTKSTNGTSWTLQNLVHFIDVSMGAMATASSKAYSKGAANVTIPSLQYTTKLDPARPPLLAIPIFLALGVVIVLLLESMRLHRRYPVPLMRQAGISELLKSSQTSFIKYYASADAAAPGEPSKLDRLEVRFVETPEGVVGLSKDAFVSRTDN